MISTEMDQQQVIAHQTKGTSFLSERQVCKSQMAHFYNRKNIRKALANVNPTVYKAICRT